MWKRLVLLCAFVAAVYATCDPRPFYGVTYAPLALDSSNMCLPVEQVEKDMEIISKLAHSVRIYNIAVCYDNAVAIMKSAQKYGMKVLMGLWMEGGNPGVFENELDALPYFMKEFGDVVEYVIVGNEPMFIEEMDLNNVTDGYHRVKETLSSNGYGDYLVSVAEVWPLLESEPGFKLIEELDFICMNMQPYWEGFYAVCPDNETDCVPAAFCDSVAPYFYELCACLGEYIHLKAEGLQNYFKKPVLLCEAGWPTKGEPCCSGSRDNAQRGFNAVPSIENASKFTDNFVSHAKRRGVKYYLHTSFDEEWKRIYDPCDECKGQQVSKFSEDECNGCVVDYNWGFYTYEREFKDGYIIPDPEPQCDFKTSTFEG